MGNGPSSPPAPAVTHPQPVVTRGGALQTRLLRTSLLKTEPLASGPGDTRPPVSSSSAPGTAVAVRALPPESGGQWRLVSAHGVPSPSEGTAGGAPALGGLAASRA